MVDRIDMKCIKSYCAPMQIHSEISIISTVSGLRLFSPVQMTAAFINLLPLRICGITGALLSVVRWIEDAVKTARHLLVNHVYCAHYSPNTDESRWSRNRRVCSQKVHCFKSFMTKTKGCFSFNIINMLFMF